LKVAVIPDCIVLVSSFRECPLSSAVSLQYLWRPLQTDLFIGSYESMFFCSATLLRGASRVRVVDLTRTTKVPLLVPITTVHKTYLPGSVDIGIFALHHYRTLFYDSAR